MTLENIDCKWNGSTIVVVTLHFYMCRCVPISFILWSQDFWATCDLKVLHRPRYELFNNIKSFFGSRISCNAVRRQYWLHLPSYFLSYWVRGSKASLQQSVSDCWVWNVGGTVNNFKCNEESMLLEYNAKIPSKNSTFWHMDKKLTFYLMTCSAVFDPADPICSEHTARRQLELSSLVTKLSHPVEPDG